MIQEGIYYKDSIIVTKISQRIAILRVFIQDRRRIIDPFSVYSSVDEILFREYLRAMVISK